MHHTRAYPLTPRPLPHALPHLQAPSHPCPRCATSPAFSPASRPNCLSRAASSRSSLHLPLPRALSLAHRCVAECQRADRAQETAESTKKQTDTDLKMDGATATDVAKEEATTLEGPAVEDAKEDGLHTRHLLESTHTNTNKHTARPVRQSTVRAHAVAAPYIQFAEHGANSHQIALISCKTSLA